MSWTAIAILIGAIAALALAAWVFIYYAAYAIRSQVFGETVWRGRYGTNAVALTFDDGPAAETADLLDILRENDIKATFFLVGKNVERRPEIARRIVAEGHEIGNHSYSHPIFLFCTPRRTKRQLYSAQRAIERATGRSPLLARPPCGVRTPAYFSVTEKLGLRTIMWTVAGFDWKTRDARQIADAVLIKAAAGSIVLLHDGDSEGKSDRRPTVEAVRLILEGLKNKNLRVAPLAELLSGEKIAAGTKSKTRAIEISTQGEK